MVLRKASIGETLPPLTLPPADPDVFSFKEGDFVKISSDRELVRKLQVGHGEWVDSMAQVRAPVCWGRDVARGSSLLFLLLQDYTSSTRL